VQRSQPRGQPLWARPLALPSPSQSMIHYGWRSVFYVIGALSLLWSMLYLLVYRNMPESIRR